MMKGWRTGTLNQFVEDFIVPQRDKPKRFCGNIPWCRIEDFSGVYLSDSKSKQYVDAKIIAEMGLKVYPVNTVLVSCSADLGRCAIVKKPLITNQTFIGLVPSDVLNPKFLYYYMSNIAPKLNELATGATIKYLSKKKFQDLVVSFPPVKVQAKIVAVLDQCVNNIDKAKANAERNLKNAKELFESYMQGVFERKGDNGWEEKKLGEICEFVRGPFGGSLKKNIFKSSGYAVYEQQHAIYNQFDEIRYFIDRDKFNEMKRFKVSAGDLIMSCSGTMGKSAIVPKGCKEGIINQALLKISPGNRIFVSYLKLWMESESFQNSLRKFSGGAAIQNVASVSILKGIAIPLPSKEVQQVIISKLCEVRKETRRLEENYQNKIDYLEELKKSILQKAFAGEFSAEPLIEQKMSEPLIDTD